MARGAATAVTRYVFGACGSSSPSNSGKQLEARRHGSGSRDRRSTVRSLAAPPASFPDSTQQLEARRHGSGSRDRRSTVRFKLI